MKRLLTIFAALMAILATNIEIKADPLFQLAGVNCFNYPKVQASFLALDANGNSYKDLTLDDFEVWDNGKIVPKSSLELVCNDPPISVMLIVDQSTSMDFDPGNGKKWDWVKEGIKAFLNQIRMIDGSAIAMTSFSSNSVLRTPFITNQKDYKTIIYDTLAKLKVYGGTDFNIAFFGDKVNLPWEDGKQDNPIWQLSQRPANMRRIIVMLTDGQHDFNKGPVMVDSILKSLKINNIQCYGITIVDTVSKELKLISEESGGKYFRVTKRDELADIYNLIARDINYKVMCDLIWNTSPSCDEVSSYRDAAILFKRQNVKQSKTYKIPPEGIAFLEYDQSVLSFGNINVNASETLAVKVTARKSDFVVKTLNIIPSTYFEVVDWGTGDGKKPTGDIIFKENETKTLLIKFTQKDAKLFRKANLYFASTPCLADLPLTGGLSQISILRPVDAEVYSSCDSIDIVWGGVDKTTQVNLTYSTDGGKTWLPIATNVTGYLYKWKPTIKSNSYKVRAFVSPTKSYMWAKSFGSKAFDHAAGLSVVKNSPYLYVCGFFEDVAKWDDTTRTSNGLKDAFLAKYDTEGNVIWVKTAGGDKNDSAAAVMASSADVAYVVGTCYSGATFGSTIQTFPIEANPAFFMAKYTKDGSVTVRTIAADNIYTGFRAWGRAVYVDEVAGKIYFRGEYSGKLKDQGRGIDFQFKTNPGRFTVVYDLGMSIPKYIDAWDASMNSKFAGLSDKDLDGNLYTAGDYSGSKSFGSFNVNSKGDKDAFITKYGGQPGSADTTGIFSVNTSSVLVKTPNVDLGSCTFGSQVDKNFNPMLINKSSLPYQISDIRITGSHPDDFFPYMSKNDYIGKIISPGDSLAIRIAFKPTDVNLRTAIMEVIPSCGDMAVINMTGNGTCDAITYPIDIGLKSINKDFDTTLSCIFYNSNGQSIDIDPQLEGTDKNFFKLLDASNNPIVKTSVAAKSCFEMKIRYTPTAPGKHTAKINYHMPQVCNQAFTNLTAEAINADLKIPDIDWKLRRVNSVNDTTVRIFNNSSLPLKIPNKDIKILNPTPDGEFVVDLSKFTTSDIIIPANKDTLIPVSFRPKNEKLYDNTLLVKVEGVSNYLGGNLKGTGYLPKIDVQWDCAADAQIGKTKTVLLLVKNPSKSSKLKINKIDLVQSGNDYRAKISSDLNAREIDMEGTATIPIDFTPSSAGLKSITFRIQHDAYDGTFKQEWKTDDYNFKCNVKGVEFTNSLDFQNVMICDNHTMDVTITNNSGDSTLVIKKSDVSVSGADAKYFVPEVNADLSIKGGDYIRIPVVFNPDEARQFIATLNIKNSFGITISIPLKGEGTFMQLDLGKADVKIIPGDYYTLSVGSDIKALSTGPITNIKAQIDYNSDMINPDNNGFSSSAQGIQWAPMDMSQKDKILISGTGSLNTPFKAELFRIKFRGFLADTNKSELKLFVDYGCDSIYASTIKFETDGVCFLDGRVIKINTSNYFLFGPNPNPVNNEIKLDYGVGIKAETTIELYNSMGELVRTLVKSEMAPGVYKLNVSTQDLNSGVYMIKYISGPYTETKQIVITK